MLFLGNGGKNLRIIPIILGARNFIRSNRIQSNVAIVTLYPMISNFRNRN